MRRITVPLLAAVVLGAAVAGAATLSSARAGARSTTKTVKLTVWVGWQKRELNEFKGVVSESSAHRLQFGRGSGGEAIDANDFMTSGPVTLPVEFNVPVGMTQRSVSHGPYPIQF